MESAETSYRRIQASIVARKIPKLQNANRKVGREIKKSGFVFGGVRDFSTVTRVDIEANSSEKPWTCGQGRGCKCKFDMIDEPQQRLPTNSKDKGVTVDSEATRENRRWLKPDLD